MRTRKALILMAAGVAVAASPLSAADATQSTDGPTANSARCQSVTYGGRTYVLFHARINCTRARRKVRYVHRYKRLPGWKCESGTNFRTGGGCSRGRKQFGWHPAD